MQTRSNKTKTQKSLCGRFVMMKTEMRIYTKREGTRRFKSKLREEERSNLESEMKQQGESNTVSAMKRRKCHEVCIGYRVDRRGS